MFALGLLPSLAALAQTSPDAPASGAVNTVLLAAPAPAATPQAGATPSEASATAAQAAHSDRNWYFSWGYSRQEYAPSDIHDSQPGLGNDFTVHQVAATDFPTDPQQTITSLFNLDVTNPQENVRVGKFMNPEKTFAVEFSLDHSKYNSNANQTANVTGTINGQPTNGPMVLSPQNFSYALHNGLNHVMINAVWLRHLHGPEQAPGDLQLISRAGAGILLPHAENTIFGNSVVVGPKNQNICCFSSNDWWQLNGWTTGVEVGLRYRIYKSAYLELTDKVAYGVLHGVPVYQGTADQTIWMNEQVLSLGYLF